MKSNCLIEALKAKVTNPTGNKIIKMGSWKEIWHKKWPHFAWYNITSGKHYCFSAWKTNAPWLKQIWYEGDVVEIDENKLKEEL